MLANVLPLTHGGVKRSICILLNVIMLKNLGLTKPIEKYRFEHKMTLLHEIYMNAVRPIFLLSQKMVWYIIIGFGKYT